MADVNVAEETSMLEALEEEARSLGSGPSEWYEFRQQPLDNIFAVLAAWMRVVQDVGCRWSQHSH